jgi:hypothetical protein
MMTFRKLAADSAGKLIRAYFTENTPQPAHDFGTEPGKVLDSGGRLTSYYTGRDSRATWRPDMPANVAKALGVDARTMPKDADLDRLFEAKRGDTGKRWTEHKRKISAYDLTLAPHKSVTLAAEFAATPAESAMIWHAIDRANDATMRTTRPCATSPARLGGRARAKRGRPELNQGQSGGSASAIIRRDQRFQSRTARTGQPTWRSRQSAATHTPTSTTPCSTWW